MLEWLNNPLYPWNGIFRETTVTYSIRPMVKEDLRQVTAIDREAFPTQWPAANYRSELQNRLAHYVVACDDSRKEEIPVVKAQKGFLDWLRPWLSGDRYGSVSTGESTGEYIIGFSGIWVLAEEAHITNIAVRQQYQRRGLGEYLLIATVDLAIELKATVMTLEVRVSNKAAQNLYRKYGFADAGLRHRYYLDNREDALIMTTESIISSKFQEQLQQLRENVNRKLETV